MTSVKYPLMCSYKNAFNKIIIHPDLEFSRVESWSQDPFLQVSVLKLLSLGLETAESWSWSRLWISKS